MGGSGGEKFGKKSNIMERNDRGENMGRHLLFWTQPIHQVHERKEEDNFQMVYCLCEVFSEQIYLRLKILIYFQRQHMMNM